MKTRKSEKKKRGAFKLKFCRLVLKIPGKKSQTIRFGPNEDRLLPQGNDEETETYILWVGDISR